MNKINVILNGETVRGITGETILELATRHGIKIPTLCHDDRLKPYSSCYVCVVDIAGKGTQPSCSTLIEEGMKIFTDNKKVFDARKMALDLLLSNHYADCVAPCKETCPAGVDVQGYISLIEKKLYSDAVALIKEDNPLPAICGRVCVRPCEVACRRNLLDEDSAVGIDYLKRFAADKDLFSNTHFKPEVAQTTGKKIAIIGAGPGGLSAAYWLQQKGHQCDIFEANKFAGGWLRYGIPEYRLPNDLLEKEIETITELGVNIYTEKKLGENLSFQKIKSDYHATILTIGSQRGTLLRAEGEEAEGVFSGIDFLRNMEMTGQRYDFNGKTIITVGGGNTAMDCCRTALRCGAERSIVVYRRTENEMPANPIEIHESKAEGVEYMLLTNPTRVNAHDDGKVKSIRLIKMELGEPDASGRRRPVPVEGSEYDLECDYILAAIGQKTEVDFLENINQFADDGQLELNRWGDIDADENTLQTGIDSVFAAGDGVTGPATIIEAVAQAKIAAHSVDMFLNGLKPKPISKPFLSKKENFKLQKSDEYINRYQNQFREEMPVLSENDRMHFKEVELGYSSSDIATHETNRCMECGCSEFFSCDLQKYATEYHVDQKKFDGDFHEKEADFSHPYIEIDNNKCILCSRCVRICSDVVGASALGFIERGFQTYVAPAMGDSLLQSSCESCGLCISACPTGAITENFQFKPGPIKLESAIGISPYGSLGEKINLKHKNGFVFKTIGENGLMNKYGNIDRYAKFAYKFINRADRIVMPMIRQNGKAESVSWQEAIDFLMSKTIEGNETAVFAGGRLTNEELFSIKEFASKVLKTKNTGSFHLLHANQGNINASELNTPVDQLVGAEKIFLLHPNINMDDASLGFEINQAKENHQVEIVLITNQDNQKLEHKCEQVISINSYYYFIKAINYYLLRENLENKMFINGHSQNFNSYKEALLAENYHDLCTQSGLSVDCIENLAIDYYRTQHAVLVCSERYLDSNAMIELRNLSLLTGKLGKTSSGIISVKEKNNTQGLFDLSICNGDAQYLANKFYAGHFKRFFVFGEDPVGSALEKQKVKDLLKATDLLVVQDYFMSETAQLADLILPASHPFEIGGSFTNTQKIIQNFDATLPSKIDVPSIEQIAVFADNIRNEDFPVEVDDVNDKMLHSLKYKAQPFCFYYTSGPGLLPSFYHACDLVMKLFDDEFSAAFK